MDRTKQRAGLSEDRRKRVRAIGTALCIVTGMALACAFAWNPIKQLVSDPEGFRSFVAEQGVWGPVLFVGLMAFQILVAVLPGEPLEIAAGYTFGVWGGTALCMAGALVGSAAVFLLVRAWGRPAAELFFPREKLESLPFLRDERKSTLLTFLLFLIPGTPKDLMRLIDRLHAAGIGVILDWVPAHFPKDGHGLVEFDGEALYEPDDKLMQEHPDWGTRIFDFGRTEVRSFLISSAYFWLDYFHADGLRIDAVASMLYLDYGRQDGQWRPNRNGGKENLEAIAFLQKLNECVFQDFPDVMMIAEESTSWPLVTKPTDIGGLGFNFKWNMGWMNDMMHYMALDPYFRQFNHKDITFSFMYAFSENFVLPVSHDEVVHGKKSLLDKMPGEYDEKFAGVRAFLTYMYAHPGKKMLFMGQEFGQFIEWNFDNGLDWLLLKYEKHAKLKTFVSALNRFYRRNAAMWEIDYDWSGFEWICHSDNNANTVVFLRRDKAGRELITAVNFSPEYREGYLIGVDTPGVYKEVFSSDAEEFGGEGRLNREKLYTYLRPQHDKPQSIAVNIAPFSGVIIKRERSLKKNKKLDMERGREKAEKNNTEEQ